MVKIYLDAGHGGKDSGAIGNGIMEKNIVLDIVKIIGQKLQANYKDVELAYTRTTDIFLSLDERTNKANRFGADIFVSVHVNSATVVTSKGFETHIYTNADAKTKALQNVMHGEIFKQISGLNVQDRGKKQSNFHVLRESNMTAILTENLFISNLGDANLLKQSAFIQKIADGHVIGLEKFLGLQTNKIPPPEQNELYQVITGTFSQKENAMALVDRLKKDGYDSYIIRK